MSFGGLVCQRRGERGCLLRWAVLLSLYASIDHRYHYQQSATLLLFMYFGGPVCRRRGETRGAFFEMEREAAGTRAASQQEGRVLVTPSLAYVFSSEWGVIFEGVARDVSPSFDEEGRYRVSVGRER
ncbi:unnamed protein product [Ectocarpus sp. 12 AP-2014]